MASSINASTAGAGGVITTADNSGVLNLQSGGNTVATVSSTGFSTPANQTINTANTFGFKNRVINGDMRIDQRNAGAALTTGSFNVDRWRLDQTTFGQAYSVQQNKNSVTPPAGFTNYLGIQMTTGVTPTGNQLMTFDQTVEGYNIADLAWGTASAKAVTVSAWVYSSLTGTFSGSLVTNSYSCVFTYSIPVANTWTKVSATIPGLTTVAPTSTTTGAGVLVYFTFGASGTFATSTTGSWQSGLYYAATGATNVVATTNATFYFTGVQLEVGSQATSFDFRSIGQETLLCQRYYNSGVYLNGFAENASSFCMTPTFPVAMRALPTITLNLPLVIYDGAVNAAQSVATTGAISGTTKSAMIYSATNFTTLTAYRPGSMNPVGGSGTYAFSAEI